ncbi:GDP-mannose transporter [Apiospora arundinis]
MSLYSRIYEWQTRLTVIKPNPDPNAHLEISLQVVDLVDVPTGAVIDHKTLLKYDALSYTWGNEPASIACTCDGTELLLRANLASALKYLRQPDRDRYVWADFICINQDDDVEKSFQIPRMGSIYSKASGVFIWLGEAPAVERVLQCCNEQCGSSCAETLACPEHRDDLWRQILEYPWFRRTWVRQEVYAAKRLEVCFPHFSMPWETFIQSFEDHETQDPENKTRAQLNIRSLNETYNELRKLQTIQPVRRLVDLLEQGMGFQATVPHDHIYSILGMMQMPKDGARTIPVDYQKSYDEVCGDVVRYVIRETQRLDILRLCTFQKNKTYTLDWSSIRRYMIVGNEQSPSHISPRNRFISRRPSCAWPKFDLSQRAIPGIEWLDLENPIRDASTSTLSDNTTTFSLSNQTIFFRPLVLYGTVWGTLARLPDDSTPSKYRVIEETDNKDWKVEPSTEVQAEGFYDIIVTKTEVCSFLSGMERAEDVLAWYFYGGREGDLLVRLEPGSEDFILRKCPTLENVFEIVGYCDGFTRPLRMTGSMLDSDHQSSFDPPRPMQRFLIR